MKEHTLAFIVLLTISILKSGTPIGLVEKSISTVGVLSCILVAVFNYTVHDFPLHLAAESGFWLIQPTLTAILVVQAVTLAVNSDLAKS